MVQRVARWLAVAGALTIACAQSDPGITTAVKSKLAADMTVKAYAINVDTTDRVVTLRGTVDSKAAKDQAIQIAAETSGVRSVVDHIQIAEPAAATTGGIAGDVKDAAQHVGAVVGDAAITTEVKSKFLADTKIPGSKIDVDTKDGVVSLSGTVSTRAEATRAEQVARDSAGVKQVVNHLRVGK